CFALLLVLAEAVAADDPKQVDQALAMLETAAKMRPAPSRAFHMRKAALLARKGDSAGEARELAEAQLGGLKTAFGHFLSGKQEFKRGRYPDAIKEFEIALRLKPDHFWAKCLMGISYIQTGRFEAAKSCVTDCHEADPGFAWLYLIRGFASG